jgi:hypothetical protein
MPRFDDRRLPRGKDGDDFQRFVWEALGSGHFEPLLSGRYVRPYFAAGNDGAIDHVAVGTEDQIIFECKFFGKERSDQPASDWTKLSRTLDGRLRANAARSYEDIDHLYKPWFDRDRPIKGYWFCTSGILSPAAQTELRRVIREFFAVLARDLPSLAHLGPLEVEVLGWNDFNGLLSARPPIDFRWFRKLPLGLRPLKSFTEGKTFRKFLEEGTLPFFSRAEFNRSIEFDNEDTMLDEALMLSALLDGSDHLGAVVSGPGGAGKTRLAVQLGVAAEESDWLVLSVERNTSPDAIEELATAYASPAQVLLVIDYAEAARSLFGIAQAMQLANTAGGHRFRFIATCRATALPAVKEALEESSYLQIEFSSEPRDRYATWVVDKILQSAKIPGADDIARICAGLPVLAAFAVYLFEQHRGEFDAQFGQIHRGDDFGAWADKRLKLALDARGIDDHSTRRLLALLAARLPIAINDLIRLRSSDEPTSRLLDLLLDDRWIEPAAHGLTAAHDIFADVIVSRYIFEASPTVTQRVGDVLSDAVEVGAFERALISINRLAAHKRFREIDGPSVIKRAHSRSASTVIEARQLLLRIALPNERTSVRILEELPDVAAAIAGDMSCDGFISYLAELVADSEEGEWRSKAALVLQPFLDQAVERPHPSNMVVRRALRLLPTRFRDRALAWIRREPTRSETHFLLVAWMRSELPLDEISVELAIWLSQRGHFDPKASFVIPAYLGAAAKLATEQISDKIAYIEPHVLRWLDSHGNTENARFVCQSWLFAAAKLAPEQIARKIADVEPHVLRWLDAHGGPEDAQVVYRTWLDAAAKLPAEHIAAAIGTVEPHVLKWIGNHGGAEDAQFVYKAWLNAVSKLDPEQIAPKIAYVKPHVLKWIGNHGGAGDAQFVYKAWIDAIAKLPAEEIAVGIADVEPHVLRWIETHGGIESAESVYQAWLDAIAKLPAEQSGARIAHVEPHVVRWLDTHGDSEAAGYVYSSWCDAGGHRKLIDDHVLRWIAKHAKIPTAQYVYRAWLSAGGPRELIDRHVLDWIEAFGTIEGADFVYRAWLDAGGNRELIDPFVLAWSEVFGEEEEAAFVYRSWLDSGGTPGVIERYLLAWVKQNGTKTSATFVYESWLAAGGDFQKLASDCIDWFLAHSTKIEASFVLKYIARQRDLPSNILHIAIRWTVRFCCHEPAIWRASDLLVNHSDREEGVALVRVFLAALHFLQLNRLSPSEPSGCILSHYLLHALEVALTVVGLDEYDREELKLVHTNLLRHSAAYEADCTLAPPHIQPALIHHVAELVQCGMIDLERDRPQLMRFADWMRAWPQTAREDLDIALSRLRRLAPCDLWDGIPAERGKAIDLDYAWKDHWQKEWNSAQGDFARLRGLAQEGQTWLGKLDLRQGGWTSVWSTLWGVDDEGLVSREELARLGDAWLNSGTVQHPRWARVWSLVWPRAQGDPIALERWLMLAIDCLRHQGLGPQSHEIWTALWSRHDLRERLRQEFPARLEPS